MIQIGNRIIETPIRVILDKLKQQLYLMGIDKLRVVEYKGVHAKITCPIHKDGNESRPSCDVLLEDKGSVNAGKVHCFACGYKANLVKFVADCMGVSYSKAIDWLFGFCDYSIVTERRDIDELQLEYTVNNNYNTLPIITVEELKSYDNVHPYMFERKLTWEVIEKFDVGYDPKTDSLTFPVYVNGVCLFVAKRRVKYKRFDLPPILPKPIYGLDYITDSEIIVCESVINALTCWVYGKQAVALFGTGSDYQIDVLNKIAVRKVVLALDGDKYGKIGTERIKKGLTDKIVTVLKLPDGKDINDLTKEEFDNLNEEYL